MLNHLSSQRTSASTTQRAEGLNNSTGRRPQQLNRPEASTPNNDHVPGVGAHPLNTPSHTTPKGPNDPRHPQTRRGSRLPGVGKPQTRRGSHLPGVGKPQTRRESHLPGVGKPKTHRESHLPRVGSPKPSKKCTSRVSEAPKPSREKGRAGSLSYLNN